MLLNLGTKTSKSGGCQHNLFQLSTHPSPLRHICHCFFVLHLQNCCLWAVCPRPNHFQYYELTLLGFFSCTLYLQASFPILWLYQQKTKSHTLRSLVSMDGLVCIKWNNSGLLKILPSS
jgi:hypothetical protein